MILKDFLLPCNFSRISQVIISGEPKNWNISICWSDSLFHVLCFLTKINGDTKYYKSFDKALIVARSLSNEIEVLLWGEK